MASGGDLGGLARAAYSVVDLLAASHDVVLIETVGVGQSETDIEFVADAVVLVLQPASGDILQFLKARVAFPLFFERSVIEVTPRRVLYWPDGDASSPPRIMLAPATAGEAA